MKSKEEVEKMIKKLEDRRDFAISENKYAPLRYELEKEIELLKEVLEI